ncbi:AAA family ATPase [Kitasatospora sp. NPDC051853]|uniref:helix-turn-helix transcriptional regulator n=1 Tax=Kitasatospora sp. NPDC051853 TaxID=3364058 RepID=UPI0037A7E0D4
MLRGRASETAAVERLLDQARGGRSAALVVRGEAGIGKSLLLEHAAVAASDDLRVLRTTGIESERELPFAGLHLLLGTVLDRIDALPPRQADALRGALGLTADGGAPGDGMAVGLAVLTLLGELAEQGPLLCVVDDAHWLDHASTDALLFAARRLHAEGVVLLFAARHLHAPKFPATGIPELWLSGLADADAGALLDEHARDLPRHVRDQILGEARGNPLALLELPAAQREGHLAAYAYGPSAQPSHTRIQQAFADRIGALPEATRTLLLVAAAESTGDLAVVLGAAGRLGVTVADAEPAERKELIVVGDGRLTFRHPLIRSAAYRGAAAVARFAAHRAVAEVLTGPDDADRRAWHLADATVGTDEPAAGLLEETAEHARARGGYAAVAAAYERAAQLTPDPAGRSRRLARAARAAADAGWIDRAAALAGQAAPHLTDPALVAETAQVRALAPYFRGDPTTAHAILLEGAEAVGPRLPAKSAFILFDAMGVIWTTGDRARIGGTVERVRELALPAGPHVTPFVDAALGLADLAAGRARDGLPALRALLCERPEALRALRLMERACAEEWAVLTGDLDTAHHLTSALQQECRDAGAVGVLPEVLRDLARAQLLMGRHRDAAVTATEAERVAEDTGQVAYVADARGVLAHLAAVGGDESRCRELAAAVREERTGRGGEWAATALGLLDLGAGRYEESLRHRAGMGPRAAFRSVIALYTLPDHIEAAARLGLPADEPMAHFSEWALATGRPWAEAVTLRCRALLAPGDQAGPLYEQALSRHPHDGRPFEQARTELLYGEWLRRSGWPSDARTPLRSAADAFAGLGAGPWADRARNELRATGEHRAPQASATGHREALSRLTPQELQVVRLAAAGLTNRDIGGQLFLSPRTVGYHLYNAYPKLGVASRGELARLDLAEEPDRGHPAAPSR